MLIRIAMQSRSSEVDSHFIAGRWDRIRTRAENDKQQYNACALFMRPSARCQPETTVSTSNRGNGVDRPLFGLG